MSVKFHLAYTRASVSTRPGASSVSVAPDTQVALFPSGDAKINTRGPKKLIVTSEARKPGKRKATKTVAFN